MSGASISSQGRTATASRLRGWDIAQLILNIATALAMAALMWASLVYAKPAVNLAGNEQLAQRIFYIHMGCNIGAFAAFIVSLIGSITYLVSRNLDWDRVTQASIEVGTIIGLGTIITGSVWSKPTWNTYWTWDPRLTASTITVLIYVAYILFRNGIDNRITKARFGSIYALFAFLSIPLTYYSARWFRSIHPVVFNGENADAQGGFAIGPSMSQTLLIATISFSLLFSALMIARWRQLRLQDRVEELREEVE
ncbi:MAG: cytochrome c biogenesis protein CcsA [Caldilineaceae bacterium]|nr:cytochrome c biogenesis protein CcsA [Caldilineaceae bacterium]MCB9162602.1 cytochrome c biogenesis protein CcsA [Caldilineaceae bacterium]